MAGKGDMLRLAQISRIEHDLRKELSSDKTDPSRKTELKALFDLQSSLLKLKAGIDVPVETKESINLTLKGELPCLRTPDGIEMYFPWSSKDLLSRTGLSTVK